MVLGIIAQNLPGREHYLCITEFSIYLLRIYLSFMTAGWLTGSQHK